MGLCKKLHTMMSELPFIKKDKKNTQQDYRYASEEAIKTAVQPALVRHGLICLPTGMDLIDTRMSPTGKQLITTILCHYRWVDTETGEHLDVSCLGTGADSNDKGVYKAITGALKYLYTTTFIIPTGDDPEGVTPQPPYDASEALTEIDRLYATVLTALDGASTLDELKVAWAMTNRKKSKLGGFFAELEKKKNDRKSELSSREV